MLPLSSDRVIDACAHELPGGGWRLWYKDEAHGSTTWSVDSPDLSEWSADRGVGHHADVVVGQDEHGPEVGWIFYFTHRTTAAADTVVDPHRLTDIHVAVLRADGDQLCCDRDAPVALDLRRTV